MVRYLLHSENATYDSTTKKHTFTLDRRIRDPVALRVSKASYKAKTSSTYPLNVYVRSDAISSLIRHKHTVELTTANHESSSNVICSLEETHTLGRYNLKDKDPPHVCHKERITREIDVYFTDNNTQLDDQAVLPAYTTMEQAVIDLSPIIWFDMNRPGTYLQSTADSYTLAYPLDEEFNLVGTNLDFTFDVNADGISGGIQPGGGTWTFSSTTGRIRVLWDDIAAQWYELTPQLNQYRYYTLHIHSEYLSTHAEGKQFFRATSSDSSRTTWPVTGTNWSFATVENTRVNRLITRTNSNLILRSGGEDEILLAKIGETWGIKSTSPDDARTGELFLDATINTPNPLVTNLSTMSIVFNLPTMASSGINQVLFKTDGYHILLTSTSTGGTISLRPRGNQTATPIATGLSVLFDNDYHLICEADYGISAPSMLWYLHDLTTPANAVTTASTLAMEVFQVLQTTHFGYLRLEPESNTSNSNMPTCGSTIIVPSKSTATRNALIAYQNAIYAGTNTPQVPAGSDANFFLEIDVSANHQ